MAIYTEQPAKLVLALSQNLPVKIHVDCLYGAISSVSFYHNGLKTVHCGETEFIDDAIHLNNASIEFNGAVNNPDGQGVKISHTIFEENGESITYIFPDDYTGTPAFDPYDEHPDYKFTVIMRQS